MKLSLFFLSFLVAQVFSLAAQTVYIPDANLKNALLTNPNVNTNNDLEIQTTEALQVTSLDLSYNTLNDKTFKDITGIEAFENLTYLNITGSQDSVLDFSSNKKLATLLCNSIIGINISLRSINLTQNKDLEHLEIFENQLYGKKLDLSQNTKLSFLDATYTRLATICLPSLSLVTANFFKDAATTYSEGCFLTGQKETYYPSVMRIAPNPFKEKTTLTCTSTEEYQIRMMDSQGKLIKAFDKPLGGNINITNEGLGKGMFHIVLISKENGRIHTAKLICEE